MSSQLPLTARLKNAISWMRECGILTHVDLIQEAADRIEELEKRCKEYDDNEHLDGIAVQAIRKQYEERYHGGDAQYWHGRWKDMQCAIDNQAATIRALTDKREKLELKLAALEATQ